MDISTSFTIASTTYMDYNSIPFLDADINLATIHPSPPPPPPTPPPSAPPPSVPPVTLEAVTELLSSLLSGEVTEEGAGAAVDTLGSMLDATSGGTAGSEVAGALVQGVESVGQPVESAVSVVPQLASPTTWDARPWAGATPRTRTPEEHPGHSAPSGGIGCDRQPCQRRSYCCQRPGRRRAAGQQGGGSAAHPDCQQGAAGCGGKGFPGGHGQEAVCGAKRERR